MNAHGGSDHPGAPRNAAQTRKDGVVPGQSDLEERLRRYAELLATSQHNLVSARDRATVYDRHIVECRALADAMPASGRWLDLGTGGGLPGMVLALVHPATDWTLLDATSKKAAAVNAFCAQLHIDNAVALAGRAETLAHDPMQRGTYDGVVARAVAPLRVLAELARGFLRPDGLLLAMKGPTWEAEVAEAGPALRALRMAFHHSQRLAVPGRDSWVVTMRAKGPPPAAYPRRDGIPRQQPL